MSPRGIRPPRPSLPHTTWDPVRDLVSLKERLNRLFESVMKKGNFVGAEVGGWMPVADMREDAEGFMLTVELPGVSRGDIQIKVESGVLTLEGHRPPDPDSRRANHLRVERSHGSFSRTFHLPGPVDEGHVTAHFHLGVLEVFVPKAPGAPGGPVRVTVS